MTALAGKLRLTIQSRYTPERARNAALRGGRVIRPWEDPEDNIFAHNGRRP